MICTECEAESADGARFCGQCGAAFERTCSNCDAVLDPGAKFCSDCGSSLDAGDRRSDTSDTPTVEAERRHLTVLFNDLVNSTALTSRLDPEEWRGIVQDYQRVCAESVEAYGGHVAQYLGDGMLCYFGYPTASEHDAENAVRAALQIVEGVAALRPVVAGEPETLQSRVGVHTGPVVVGEMGSGQRRETLAVGKTTNLAARIQSIATPNSIYTSSSIERLVRGRFEFESLGEHDLKGIDEPVSVFSVLSAHEHKGRLDLASKELTPFTGRAPDLAILLDRWQRAVAGTGQVALVSGEAGIGKSRLLRVLRDRVLAIGQTWLECRAAHYSHEKALDSVIEMVHKSLGFRTEHTPHEKLTMLRRAVDGSMLTNPEAITMLAALLDLPTDGLPELAPLPPAHRRRLSLETLADWLIGLSKTTPVVIALEDLHWMDASSLEWIDILVSKNERERVLILATTRPKGLPDWAQQPHVLTLNLARLNQDEAKEIVHHIWQKQDLVAGVLEDIATRTDGNPLYIEELTNAVLASRALGEDPSQASAAASPIPETLQDSLTARLDAAGPAKEIAQLGACIGREFRFDILEAIWQRDPELLQEHVRKLVTTGLIFRRNEQREIYLFKHALIRDSAYQSILKRRRQEIHAHIAQTLTSHFEDVAENQPELLAHHFTAGAMPEQAIDYLLKAGSREHDRSAYVEAIGHFESALETLKDLPESPENYSKELAVRMSLGRLLASTAGYGAEAVRANADRTGELCELIGESPEIFPALFDQWSFHMGEENPERMAVFAQKLVDLAKTVGDRGLQVETELAMGMTRHVQGNIDDCALHMERSTQLYDAELDRDHATIYGHDPFVMALAVGGVNLAYAGHLDKALEWQERAQEQAANIEHPFTSCASLAWFASTLNHRREPELALKCAEQAHSIASEGGFKLMICGALGHMSAALVELGRLEEGVEAAIESTKGFEECNSRIGCLTPIIALAKARLLQGMPREGLESTAQSRAILAQEIDPHHLPETLRLEAELLLLQSPDATEEAEERLREALAVADEQSFRLYGLAAAASLTRLLIRTGRQDTTRAILEPRFAWFSEGLDTPHLRDASDLLAKL